MSDLTSTIKLARRFAQNKKNVLENTANAASENKKYYFTEYKRATNELTEAVIKLRNFNFEKESINFLNTYSKISEIPNVKILSWDNDSLNVKRDKIICYEPYTDKFYKIPDTEIHISMTDGKVTFMSEDTRYMRDGYWSGYYNELQVHPHVDTNGVPCLGSCEATLAEQFSENDYYGMVITAIGFLQSVNIDDIAGAAICRWDECDRDGVIIKDGHDPEVNEYEGYGCETEALEKYGHMVMCEECGEMVPEDDAHYCDVCGRTVCEDCWNEDAGACVVCATEELCKCEACGLYINPSNEEFYQTPTGEIFCIDCYDEYKEFMKKNYTEKELEELGLYLD